MDSASAGRPRDRDWPTARLGGRPGDDSRRGERDRGRSGAHGAAGSTLEYPQVPEPTNVSRTQVPPPSRQATLSSCACCMRFAPFDNECS
jgi:hypothetical protein